MTKSPVTSERVAELAALTLSNPTVPFHEGSVVRQVERFAAARAWVSYSLDADGNVHLSRRGARASNSPVVFSAHMDHPGFLARACARRGKKFRVAADFLGGVEDAYFPGAAVRFWTGSGGAAARVLSTKRDPKTGDRSVLLESPVAVAPGTPGMWDLLPFRHDKKKDLLWSRAVDDLAGVTAILALFDVLPRVDPRGRADVRGVFTRGEEVGFWGAIGAARSGRWPKGARLVSLEASKAFAHAPAGKGPILRAGDRASVFDDGLTRAMAGVAARLAAKGGFDWQRKLMDGGTCEGTAYQAYGYTTGALCVPLLNYHNMDGKGRIAAEAVRLSDLTGMARWMAAWTAEEAAGAAPGRPLKERMEGYYGRWRGKIPRVF
jgi:endoglucanase